MSLGEPVKKVAMLTGASGFLGGSLLKHLLDDSFYCILLLRNKTIYGRKRGQVKQVVAAEERVDEVMQNSGLPARYKDRIFIVEGDVGVMDVAKVVADIRNIMVEKIGHRTIDFLINCAGRLTMDHPGLPAAVRKAVESRNRTTNVQGMENLVNIIEGLSSSDAFRPPLARVIRPSIIAGPGSSDAYMAFIDYLGRGFGPFKLAKIAMFLLRLRSKVVIPLPANPRGVLDVIDIKEVVKAMKAFVTLDQSKFSRQKPAGIPGIQVRAFHHVSTCYVHGESKGLLAEGPLIDLGNMTFKNSYEATKAQGEATLEEWNRRHNGVEIRYNQVSNAHAPDMETVFYQTAKAFGGRGSEASRIIAIPPGDDFDQAMKKLRRRSILLAKILDGMWKKLPMLKTYLMRQEATVFSISNTVEDLDSVGVGYAPPLFSAEWIQTDLLGQDAVAKVPEVGQLKSRIPV